MCPGNGWQVDNSCSLKQKVPISVIHLVGSPRLTRMSGMWFKIQKHCLCLEKEVLFLKRGNNIFRAPGIFSMWIYMDLFTIVSPTRAVRANLKTFQDVEMIAQLPPAESTALSICCTNSIVCFCGNKFRIRQCCVCWFGFFFNVDLWFEMFQRMAFKSFAKLCLACP